MILQMGCGSASSVTPAFKPEILNEELRSQAESFRMTKGAAPYRLAKELIQIFPLHHSLASDCPNYGYPDGPPNYAMRHQDVLDLLGPPDGVSQQPSGRTWLIYELDISGLPLLNQATFIVVIVNGYVWEAVIAQET